MNRKSRSLELGLLLISMLLPLMLGGCNGRVDAAAEAPPPANVVPDVDLTLFTLDHPEQFPLAAATAHPITSELIVTGAVTPEVSRNVPVVSPASGRVVAVHARLGDTVKKGQLLLTFAATTWRAVSTHIARPWPMSFLPESN
jgi:multidrug efflux pump subunit AcrA (membrane-fusion protein)